MQRRTVIQGLAASAASLAIQPSLARDLWRSTKTVDWRPLRTRLGDRLIKIDSPLTRIKQANGAGAEAFFAKLQNPYLLGDEPGLTQTLGWADAWTSHPSEYAVAAESADDVAVAIDFARTQRVRLVVRGGGHSYFGNSNAADSLLIWTRKMDGVELHDAFIPQGAPVGVAAMQAVTVGAGALWGPVYHKVAVESGRYVQGGGCLTVGVAGFTLGGGFGSFSKQFGTGASNLLQAEIVTADGRIRTVNEWNEPDLYFALRGGGGGSFGVVTRLTMRTHELPKTFGAVIFEVEARSNEAWRELVARMIDFYATSLFNSVWGEQIRFKPGRAMAVSMLFHGLDEGSARAVWKPMFDWLKKRPTDFRLKSDPLFIVVPARRFWDPEFLHSLPGVVLSDDRPGAPSSNIYWASNRSEAGQLLYAYQSSWLPQSLLRQDQQANLIDALIDASSKWDVTLHTNKGLAGGLPDAVARTRETSTNPAVLDAFALLIVAAEGQPAWPGIGGYEPNLALAKLQAAGVSSAMAPIRRLVPGAGTYMSESDYFLPNWKQAYWGEHYPRLAAAKRRYDPTGLFQVHHGVEAS